MRTAEGQQTNIVKYTYTNDKLLKKQCEIAIKMELDLASNATSRSCPSHKKVLEKSTKTVILNPLSAGTLNHRRW